MRTWADMYMYIQQNVVVASEVVFEADICIQTQGQGPGELTFTSHCTLPPNLKQVVLTFIS